MRKFSVADIMGEGQSPYSFVVGVAKRAREIANNDEGIGTQKNVIQALDDIQSGKYEILTRAGEQD